MKSIFKFTFLAAFVSFFYSCSEKVNLIGDFKETAVVYGLLDHSDSIHFIKITRAFIGPGNAIEIAKIPDSNYFSQVEATVSEFVNGTLTRTWVLEDTIIENKDTNGAFYGPEQKVYYFKTLPTTVSSSGLNGVIQTSQNPQLTSLNPDATYKLVAKINGGDSLAASGGFNIIGETELVKGIATNISPTGNPFKFVGNEVSSYINPDPSFSVTNTGNSFIMNCKFEVTIKEFRSNTITEKSFLINLGEKDVKPSQNTSFSLAGLTFYNSIKDNVSIDPTIDRRTLKSLSVIFTGGAEEFFNYISVNKPSSTLAQSKPSYTNLTVTQGKRVIGLFSSRQTFKITKDFRFFSLINGELVENANVRCIDNNSTRDLCIGPVTGFLLFCSDHKADVGGANPKPYACQ